MYLDISFNAFNFRRKNVFWGVLTACIPFSFFPFTLFGFLVSYMICFDLWLFSGKPFKPTEEDQWLGNGYIKGGWFSWVPGLHTIEIWNAQYQLWKPLKQMFKIEKELLFATPKPSSNMVLLSRQKRDLEVDIRRIKYRLSVAKTLEVMFECIGELILQGYIVFYQAGTLHNIPQYIIQDIETNGFLASTLSALLSSLLSNFYFFAFNAIFFVFVNDNLHVQSPNVSIFEKCKVMVCGFVVTVMRLLSISFILNSSPTMVLVIFLCHFLMHTPKIREMWGHEQFTIALLLVYFMFCGLFPAHEPKGNTMVYLSLGSSSMVTFGLWILLMISYVSPSLLNSNVTNDVDTYDHFCLTLSIVSLVLTPILVKIFVNSYRKTNVRLACVSGDLVALQQMLKSQSIDWTEIDFYKRNCFILACEYGQLEVVQWLFQNVNKSGLELDFNQQNVHGQTAFHVALVNGHTDIIKLILQHANTMNINLPNDLTI